MPGRSAERLEKMFNQDQMPDDVRFQFEIIKELAASVRERIRQQHSYPLESGGPQAMVLRGSDKQVDILQQVAEGRLEVEAAVVDKVLGDLGIPTSASKGVPVHLRVARVSFSGTKRLDPGRRTGLRKVPHWAAAHEGGSRLNATAGKNAAGNGECDLASRARDADRVS